MPSFLILARRVLGLTPSSSPAPPGPWILPPVMPSTRRMWRAMTASSSRMSSWTGVADATSYLGRFVCRELRERGYFVRALVRSPHRLERLWNVTDEIIHGEVTKPETLTGLCDGVDVVFSSMASPARKTG